MDTEEDLEIQKAFRTGQSQTDEGPYYHTSWWESYKGGVKGKLGGIAVGALPGAAVGLVAAAVLSFVVPGGVSILAVTAGFAAAGMIYGAHEFSEVGKITGAVAAAHEESEERMKSFENSKFQEIKNEINELKSMVTGKPVTTDKQAGADAAKSEEAAQNYKNKHTDDHAVGFKPIFWKIAAIGLAVGLAVGALLVAGHISEHVIEAFGGAAEPLSKAGTIGTMLATGLFGASFGINRDIFRNIFDRTDHLFKGIIVPDGKDLNKTIESSQQVVTSKEKDENTITTVVYDNYSDRPQSDTHYRNMVLTQAKEVLLGMDHTKARPH